jgi:hypothetical protein
MSGERITLTREALFELVWSKPKTAIAEELGISDVAVRKICLKLNVPMPPQGYWLRSRQGKKPELKPSKGPQEYQIWKNHVVTEEESELSLDPDIKALLDFEKEEKNRVEVKKRLRSAHPLVQTTLNQLLKTTKDDYGRVQSGNDSNLRVNISPQSVKRGMLILDALVKALERRGFPVIASNGYGQTAILGEDLRFKLEEPAKRSEPKLTARQKAQIIAEPWLHRRYVYEPSGCLFLKIETYTCDTKQILKDRKNRKIEDCLNQFILYLIEGAIALRARRLERQKREEEYRRRQLEWEEAKQRYDDELARVQKLKEDSANWVKSQQIRSYIKAVIQHVDNGAPIHFSSGNFDQWVNWATAQADRLDPFRKSPPSILDYPIEDGY